MYERTEQYFSVINLTLGIMSPPVSESSPHTEDYPSECSDFAAPHLHYDQRGSTSSHQAGGPGGAGGGGQYSSQDSLPDSPYSSQSLDSQPANAQDRFRRSMPNLNKRGVASSGLRKASHQQVGSAGGAPGAGHYKGGASSSGYGLSRQHNSDPRLQQSARHQQHQRSQMQQQQQHQQPQQMRDREVNKDAILCISKPSYVQLVPPLLQQYQQPVAPAPSNNGRYSALPTNAGSRVGPGASGIRPPTATSRIARPTGIPRPGSRLPMFAGASSRGTSASRGLIPKPGSRSSSIGRQQQQQANWNDDCY